MRSETRKIQNIQGGISAVVIAYNAEDEILSTLQALKKQTSQPDEIIVVDDCSIDLTVHLVREMFPDTSIITSWKNSGPGVARNIGLHAATFSHIIVIDHDIELEPTALSELKIACDMCADETICVPVLVYSNSPTTVQTGGSDVHFFGISLRPTIADLHRSQLPSEPWSTLAFGSGCFMVRNPAHFPNRFTYFDPAFFYGFEDTDFALANHRNGFQAVVVPTAIARHHIGTSAGLSHIASQKIYPQRKLGLIARNHLLIIAKHFDAITVLLISPWIIVFQLLLFLFGAVRSTSAWAAPTGTAKFLRRLSSVRSQRRAFIARGAKPVSRHLLASELRIKPSTVQGRFIRPAFLLLNRVLRYFGTCVLSGCTPNNGSRISA